MEPLAYLFFPDSEGAKLEEGVVTLKENDNLEISFRSSGKLLPSKWKLKVYLLIFLLTERRLGREMDLIIWNIFSNACFSFASF